MVLLIPLLLTIAVLPFFVRFWFGFICVKIQKKKKKKKKKTEYPFILCKVLGCA